MAKVVLYPIGKKADRSHIDFVANEEIIEEKEQNLSERFQKTKTGWGEKYAQRVHKKDKLTTHERIALLLDKGEELMPVLTFVNEGRKFGKDARTSPGAGVVTGFGKVHDRWILIIANDNTVASGSWWPKTPEKIIRAQEMALKLGIPVVYLVDCSGLYLPEQSKTFPGRFGAGRIFKLNAELSNAGVPQIAGVMGDCIAGGGYMPLISDRVFMTENAYMVIAGAALIQGAKSQNLSSHDIGGPHVHVHLSACADERVPDDKACLEGIRREISKLPSSAIDYYRNGCEAAPPLFEPSELTGLVSASPKAPYDIRQIIARLVDDSLFWEVMPHMGQEVVVGIAKISGLYVGICANVQALTKHPRLKHQKRPGGILYKEGVQKLSLFSRTCNDDGIPLIWLQDVSGFDVGAEAEKEGLLGYGSSLIYTNSNNATPMATVLLRKASGAGYYAMSGLPYEPVMQLSTVLSRLSVMEGKTLAIGAFGSKLDANFQIVAISEAEKSVIKQGMAEVEARIEQDMDPYGAASDLSTDEIIKLKDIRSYLVCFTQCAYQQTCKRRIKNPRIWSLHDLVGSFLGFGPVEKQASNVDLKQSESELQLGEEDDKSLILAPMDGLFYTRSSPDKDNFVSPGDLVQPGDTLGLIEVMKCYYPLLYEGSKPLIIKEILVKSGSSIKSGQLLMRTKT